MHESCDALPTTAMLGCPDVIPRFRREDKTDGDVVSRNQSRLSHSIASPPDGGWGWVVTASSFMANLIADGCCFSFGILFNELLQVFEEPKGKTAWVGSLILSMPLICGPIASACTNRYGCRKTSMAGGLIACFGCIASVFINSIDMLCITFGVISGFGLALVYVPSLVVVAFYFEKKRAFVTGIAVAGSGIGVFIFAPLTEYLIQEYSWRGALLITGSLLLNLVVCGALFRPLPEQVVDQDITDYTPSPRDTSKRFSFSSSPQYLENYFDVSSMSAEIVTYPAPRFVLKAQICDGDCVYAEPNTNSLVALPTFLSEDEISDKELTIHLQRKCQMLCKIHASCDLGRAYDIESLSRNGINTSQLVAKNSNSEPRQKILPKLDEIASPNGRMSFPRPLLHLYRRDAFYRGGLVRAGFFLEGHRSTSCPDIYFHSARKSSFSENLKEFSFSGMVRSCRELLKKMFDISLLKSANFNYFCLHCMLLYISYGIPYVYVPGKAIECGISENLASTLVSIIGICSTVGQILMGYIGDRPCINTLYFYNIMVSLAGLITLLLPLISTFPLLAVYSGFFGFFISASYVLTPIILVDLLGMDKLTNAVGITSLAQGLANLFGPPLAGWISDSTGSSDLSFYLAGMTILISGCMLFAVPCIQKCTKNGNKSPILSGTIFELTINEWNSCSNSLKDCSAV